MLCVNEAFNTLDQWKRDELLVLIFEVVCSTSILVMCLISIKELLTGGLNGFETRMVPPLQFVGDGEHPTNKWKAGQVDMR